MTGFILRPAADADLPAIVEIYNATIPSRMVTADLEPVTVEARLPWLAAHQSPARPIWVLQDAAWQRPVSEAGDKALAQLAQRFKRWEIVPSGTEGYKKAEVTVGGVDTRDLSSQTMESKQPGLFFIGEVVDVTGWLGGYNFQWAWASAFACAHALQA